MITQKITPSLWFDHQAEEAALFYTSIFKKSKINHVTRFGKEGFEIHHMPEGTVMTVDFELDDQPFSALNGGPLFHFTEAISFQVFCQDQQEVDYFWTKLTEGGDPQAQQCGWLKDKFGVSWQVIPQDLGKYIGGPDAEGAQRATAAMLQMKKLDIEEIKKAYEGG
jgi:predicted 3-demethylubiquinone-9 3-methyltransferase (glyoxalase superfamily)